MLTFKINSGGGIKKPELHHRQWLTANRLFIITLLENSDGLHIPES